MVMWGITITWCPLSSSVNLYILIFFSETTGPIQLEPKGYSLFCWSEVDKRNKKPKSVKIYGYLFIVHLFFIRIFIIISLIKKIPYRNMHNLISVFDIKGVKKGGGGGGFIRFLCSFLQIVHLYELLMDH